MRRPRAPDGSVAGASAFKLEGNNAQAVLLLHGFNDTPQSMRYLADRLNRIGFTVHVPLLPGHGVSLPLMAAEARSEAWLQAVRDAWQLLSDTHAKIHLCGQSMGGALSVILATSLPRSVNPASIALLSPYLGWPLRMKCQLMAAAVMQVFTPYIGSGAGDRSIHDPEARAQALGPGIVTVKMLKSLRTVATAANEALVQLRAPVLYLQSREDNRIKPGEASEYFANVGSAEKRIHWLENCGHIISADYCREAVSAQVAEWFMRH